MRPAKTTVVHFSSQIARSVIGFLATLYFANELGPGPLGVYFVAIAMLAWLNIPSTAVVIAIKKRLSEQAHGGEYLTAGFVLNLGIGVVIGVGLLAFSPWIEDYLEASIVGLIVALLLARIVFGTVAAGLEGQKQVARSGVLKSVDQLFRAGFQVGLVILGYGVAGLVIGHTAALILAAGIGLAVYSGRLSMPDLDTFRNLIGYAQFSWLGSIRTQTYSWMDILVLNLFVVPALIGIYEVAWKLASVLVLVNVSIQHTLFPEISDLAASDDYAEVRTLIDEALLFSGIFTIPGLFGAAVVGPELLELYGEEFVRGGTILLVLILARSIDVYGSVFNNTLNAIDRPDVAFRINIVFTVVNVGLNLVLVYLFGWIGAAIATTASAVVVLGLGYRAVIELVGSFPIPYRGLLAQVLAAAGMAAVVATLERLLPWRNTPTTIALVLVGAGVYAGALFLLSPRVRGKAVSLLPERVTFP